MHSHCLPEPKHSAVDVTLAQSLLDTWYKAMDTEILSLQLKLTQRLDQLTTLLSSPPPPVSPSVDVATQQTPPRKPPASTSSDRSLPPPTLPPFNPPPSVLSPPSSLATTHVPQRHAVLPHPPAPTPPSEINYGLLLHEFSQERCPLGPRESSPSPALTSPLFPRVPESEEEEAEEKEQPRTASSRPVTPSGHPRPPSPALHESTGQRGSADPNLQFPTRCVVPMVRGGTGSRRLPEPSPGVAISSPSPARPSPGLLLSSSSSPVSSSPVEMLVEFKRNRILQFQSVHRYVAGDYVVVGGDRGEDVGLVIYTWQRVGGGGSPSEVLASCNTPLPVSMGVGVVIRKATSLEVTQLHGVQTELEKRAVEVAQAKVKEQKIPMRIIDAEYQFDRKKLTFFYYAEQRQDFRDLVRELYKAFRARIWMEMVEGGHLQESDHISEARVIEKI